MKYLALFGAAVLSLLHGGQQPLDSQAPEGSAQDRRVMVIACADRMIGWHEATGRNDGAQVDAILASVGLAGTRNPYCAAFVVKVGDDAFGRAHNPYPRSAWSPDMVANPTWKRGKGAEPLPGDVGSIYFASKGRVAHVFLIRRNLGSVFETDEANTSPEASSGSSADRDGGGVYRKRRLKSQVYAVQNWIGGSK